MVVIPRRIGSAGHSDEQLIARCLRGDSGAWDEIVERYGRLVYSIPRRYGMAEQDADDVFQSVFVIAMQKLDTLRDCSRLSSWLITTTHRECWRLGRRPGAMGDLDQTIEDVGSPAPEQVEIWETQHLIHQALSLLGGSCETLLRALFLDGAESDYETIARRLNIKVGSIGPTRARCFGKLERILADLGHEAVSPASMGARYRRNSTSSSELVVSGGELGGSTGCWRESDMSTPGISQSDLLAYASGELSESEATIVAEHVRMDPSAAAMVARYRAIREHAMKDDGVEPPADVVKRAKAVFKSMRANDTTSWIDRISATIAEIVFDSRVQAVPVRVANTGRRIQLSYGVGGFDIDLLIERIEPAVGPPAQALWRVMGQIDGESPIEEPIEVAAVCDGRSETAVRSTDEDAMFSFAVRSGRYDVYVRLPDGVAVLPGILIE